MQIYFSRYDKYCNRTRFLVELVTRPENIIDCDETFFELAAYHKIFFFVPHFPNDTDEQSKFFFLFYALFLQDKILYYNFFLNGTIFAIIFSYQMGVWSTVIKHNEPKFNNDFLEITEAPKPQEKCWNRIVNYYDSRRDYNVKRRTLQMRNWKNELPRKSRQKNKSKPGDYTNSRIIDDLIIYLKIPKLCFQYTNPFYSKKFSFYSWEVKPYFEFNAERSIDDEKLLLHY